MKSPKALNVILLPRRIWHNYYTPLRYFFPITSSLKFNRAKNFYSIFSKIINTTPNYPIRNKKNIKKLIAINHYAKPYKSMNFLFNTKDNQLFYLTKSIKLTTLIIFIILFSLFNSKYLNTENFISLEEKLQNLLNNEELGSNNFISQIDQIIALLKNLNITKFSLEQLNTTAKLLSKISLLLRGKDLAKTIEFCTLNIKIFEKNIDNQILVSFYSSRAYAWLNQGNETQAYTDFYKITVEDNTNADAYYQLGLLYLRHNIFYAALDSFNKVMDLTQGMPQFLPQFLQASEKKSKVERIIEKRQLKIERVHGAAATTTDIEKKTKSEAKINFDEEIKGFLFNIVKNEQSTHSSTALHEAVKRGDNLFNFPFDTISNVDSYDNKGKTALMYAAESGNIKAIEKLLYHNANSSMRSGIIYQNDMEQMLKTYLAYRYAIDAKKWSAVVVLLRNTVYFFEEQLLQDYVLNQADKYMGSKTSGPTYADLALLNKCASQLTTTPISAVLNEDFLEKYKQHIKSVNSLSSKEMPSAGMRISDFLSLRAYFLLYAIFAVHKIEKLATANKLNLQNSGILEMLQLPDTPQSIKISLFNELHITLETFYSNKVAFEIRALLGEKNIPIEEIKAAYIDAHVQKITRMAENKEYVYPAGWLGGNQPHAVYVGFFKKKGINIRIDNLGIGHEFHKKDNKSWYYPCYRDQKKIESIKMYLTNLFTAHYLSPSSSECLKDIYDLNEKNLQAAHDGRYCGVGRYANPKQQIANCVMVNFNIGAYLRLNSSDNKKLIFEWYYNNYELSLLDKLILWMQNPIHQPEGKSPKNSFP